MPRTWIIALVVAAAAGCSSAEEKKTTEPGAGSPNGSTAMTTQEAQQVIAQARARAEAPDTPPEPTSLNEVRDIVRSDEIRRFDAARRVSQGDTGPDALALRSILESSWASAQMTVAAVMRELAKRRSMEVRRLQQQAEGGDTKANADVDAYQAQIAQMKQNSRALDVLAQSHLDAAKDLLDETLRTAPEAAPTHRAAALYYLVAKDWSNFDKTMPKMESLADAEAFVAFLRGMEAIQRNLDRDKAIQLLEEARTKDQGLVRVQANLVLLNQDVTARYGEFEKLEAMSPRHPLVVIAGPDIRADFASAQELAGAPPS